MTVLNVKCTSSAINLNLKILLPINPVVIGIRIIRIYQFHISLEKLITLTVIDCEVSAIEFVLASVSSICQVPYLVVSAGSMAHMSA